MTSTSNKCYQYEYGPNNAIKHKLLENINFKDVMSIWNAACSIWGHAASAVNITHGGALWHTFVLSMAIANTILAPAGILPTAPLPPTKWAGRSNPGTTSTTSMVSKPTTATQTSLSYRHPLMPKFTTNNLKLLGWVISITHPNYLGDHEHGRH